MSFCKKKAPITAQKIVIPRGMINPNETTIIEIPARLHNQPKQPTTYFEDDPVVYTHEYPVDQNKSKRPVSPKPRPISDDSLDYSKFLAGAQHSTINDERRGASALASTCTPQKNPRLPLDDSMYSAHDTSIYVSSPELNLDETEREEKMALEQSLAEFQMARRKLLTSASQLANHSNFENVTKYRT